MKRRTSTSVLVYWARERESIRKKKLLGLPPPWTDDKILQKYRFCSLRRSDDRVSQWLIRHVFSHQKEFSPWSFIQFTALCRWVNWPPTLAAMRDCNLWPAKELDFGHIGGFIDGRCTVGAKTWTGAYLIRAPKPRVHGVMGKGEFITKIVVGQGLDSVRDELEAALEANQAQAVWTALTQALYWGRFMSFQLVMDWTYTPLLKNATDLYTWAAQGPGSCRGFNRLLRRPLNSRISEEEWCSKLQLWRRDLIAALGSDYETLTLGDCQNALCEVDKYLRVLNREGRPRSIYKPETGY